MGTVPIYPGLTPAGPVSAAEFDRQMRRLGPFEARPHLAVAVSGGADSMALVLLADGWVRRRRGRLTALTVDHGLRPEAAAEARAVGRWMRRRGIAHRVLRWSGTKLASGVQAAARRARYGLMGEWCRHAGVLHLGLAHHRDDQAETVLLRLAGGSGTDGLAAMAAIVETPAVRLLRPLLGVAPEALRAFLGGRRQEWIEDPSNRDPRYARARLRRLMGGPEDGGGPEGGLEASRLAAAAVELGAARQALEVATAALLAQACALHPAGFACLRPAALATAPEAVARRALGRVLACIGGTAHPPGRAKLERLLAALGGAREASSRTLGGCRMVASDGFLLVCREARHHPPAVAAVAGRTVRWDERFDIEMAPRTGGRGARIARLGRGGWSQVVAARPGLRAAPMPAPVRPTLPALWDASGVVAVPHLGYLRDGADGRVIRRLAFRPRLALSPLGFFLAQ